MQDNTKQIICQEVVLTKSSADDFSIFNELCQLEGIDTTIDVYKEFLALPNINFTLRKGDKQVGFIHILEGGEMSMMIHPDHRGQGIGKQAAKAVVEYATSNGYKILHLKTTFDNVAVKKIYGNLGFKFTTDTTMEWNVEHSK